MKEFRFWCQKVLPLVYDDSISYYELLCKVVDKLNSTIGELNTVNDGLKQLQVFVDNYFKSFDVQKEVDKKLDEMATDGTLQAIVAGVLNITKTYKDVSELVGDTTLNIGDIVHVYGSCFDGYDANDCTLKITNAENRNELYKKAFTIQLNNGLYAETFLDPACRISANTNAGSAVVKTALTYFDRANFAYSASSGNIGMFDENCVPNNAGKYGIDCSTLCLASLQGIPYENSRYLHGTNYKNVVTNIGYTFPDGYPKSVQVPTRNSGYLANEIAFYAYTHGWLFKVDNANELCCGDILFWADFDDYEYAFKQIGHCQVVINPQLGDSYVQVIEAGSGKNRYQKYGDNEVKIGVYKCGVGTKAIYAARFPYTGNQIIKDITSKTSKQKSHTGTLTETATSMFFNFNDGNHLRFTENLRIGEIYTAVVCGEFSNAYSAGIGFYFSLANEISLGNTYYNRYTKERTTNCVYYTFTPLRDSNSAVFSDLWLEMYSVYSGQSVSVEATTTLNSAKVYKGIVVNASGETNGDVSPSISVDINQDRFESVEVKEFDSYYLLTFTGSNYDWLTGSGNFNIASVDASVPSLTPLNVFHDIAGVNSMLASVNTNKIITLKVNISEIINRPSSVYLTLPKDIIRGNQIV